MDFKISEESTFQLINDNKKLQKQLVLQRKYLNKKEQEIISRDREIELLKDQFTEFYDFNSSAFFTIDKEYRIQAVNFQGAFLLNYDRKQLINKNFLDLTNPFQQDTLKNCIRILLKRQIKQVCELELLAKGGERKKIRTECLITKDNLIQLILSDITYVRQLESQRMQLNQSLNAFTNILQNVSDAIATLDKEFYFKIVNPSFIKFFSKIFSTKIRVGMNFLTLISDFSEYKQKLTHACHEALLGKETTILIENNNDRYEATFCYELNFTPIYNSSGLETEIILLIKDLTQFYLRKKLRMKEQSKLAHAIRLNTMEGMASALAHEINQPLTAIFLYSQTCLLHIQRKEQIKQLDGDLEKVVSNIISQTKHASEIMSRMKYFIHQEVNVQEDTDINTLIEDAMIFLEYEVTKSKLKIKLMLEKELPMLRIDKIQMKQAILNLARNSIEAMREEPHITPVLTIQTKSIDGHIEIHIRDNGPGIKPEHREKILNSYFTTKPQGTGLGLTICRTIIEAHGGKLYVKNSDAGAWFVFTLPK